MTPDEICLLCMQFAGYVLEKLPHMKNMSSDVLERKISHLALLGTLLNLYNGPTMLKLDSTRAGGLTFLSKRTNVPVRPACNMSCSVVHCGAVKCNGVSGMHLDALWVYEYEIWRLKCCKC